MTYQYPLKLISPPRNTQQHLSALVFLLSYGGGLVSGDNVNLQIKVGQGSKLCIVTQGHTKIFKASSPYVITRQNLDVVVDDGAALCLLPDPVQPFAESVYEQVQIFRLQGADASLCLLDWVTQGRSARGEDWDLIKWFGRNEIWWSDSAPDTDKARLLIRDAVKLDASATRSDAVRNLRENMHGNGIFGTLILCGPLLKALGAFFLAEFAALPRIGARDWRSDQVKKDEDSQIKEPHEAWRSKRLALEREGKILWSAANVRGCVVVKFGAATVEGGRMWIGSMLTKEGTVAQGFGDQALMCVR